MRNTLLLAGIVLSAGCALAGVIQLIAPQGVIILPAAILGLGLVIAGRCWPQ